MSDDRKSDVRGAKKLTDDFEFQHDDVGSECVHFFCSAFMLLDRNP